MANPGATITINIQALTDEANAKLQSFFGNLNANLKNSGGAPAADGLKKTAEGAKETHESLQKVRESSQLLKESFHSLQGTVLLLGGQRFGLLGEALAVTRAGMGATRTMSILTGVAMGELLIPIIAITAALLPTGVTAWQAYKAKVEETNAAMAQAAQTTDLVARNFQAINTALDKGYIKPDDFLYINKLLSIGTESALKAAQARMAQLGISVEQISVFEKLVALEEKMKVGAMDADGQERAKATELYNQRLAEIKKLAEAGKMAADERRAAEKLADAEINAAMERITKANQTKNAAELQKSIEDDLFFHQQALSEKKKMSADEEFRFRTDKFHAAVKEGKISEDQYTAYVIEQMKKRAAAVVKDDSDALRADLLKQEIARAKTAADLAGISSNPLLSSQQKDAASLPLLQEQSIQNLQRLASLQKTMHDNDNEVVRLEAEKQYYALKVQEAELQNKISAAQGTNSFSYNFQAQFAGFASQLKTFSQDAAALAMSPFTGMQSGIENAFNTLLTKGSSAKQFFGNIALGIGQSMVGAFSKMVADWIMSHVVMAGISSIFHLGETAKTGAATTAQVGIHATAEGAKTGATSLGALARNAVRWAETLVHNIGVGLRTIFHLGGETAATTATIAGATTRIGAHAAAAGAGAAEAEASIPFVGPILAIAAMAAIIAAVLALAGGFEAGGYTGDGGTSDVAGVVHKKEWVIPASRVSQYGHGFFQAIHDGSLQAQDLASMAAPGGAVQPVAMAGGGSAGSSKGGLPPRISVYAHIDPAEMARKIEKDDAHQKYVVNLSTGRTHKV